MEPFFSYSRAISWAIDFRVRVVLTSRVLLVLISSFFLINPIHHNTTWCVVSLLHFSRTINLPSFSRQCTSSHNQLISDGYLSSPDCFVGFKQTGKFTCGTEAQFEQTLERIAAAQGDCARAMEVEAYESAEGPRLRCECAHIDRNMLMSTTHSTRARAGPSPSIHASDSLRAPSRGTCRASVCLRCRRHLLGILDEPRDPAQHNDAVTRSEGRRVVDLGLVGFTSEFSYHIACTRVPQRINVGLPAVAAAIVASGLAVFLTCRMYTVL
ncbi:hypothetical protein EDB84DRAFT_1469367 [Lactarius hengduanensis]|nr:hypothetical protein EDB84DRAFT_1469367 [Lactarius hengduanensis]